jgi:hypothetical protein
MRRGDKPGPVLRSNWTTAPSGRGDGGAGTDLILLIIGVRGAGQESRAQEMGRLDPEENSLSRATPP